MTPAQQITQLCALPYAQREQKYQGLFALVNTLSAQPADDEQHRLLARIYDELFHFETALQHQNQIQNKTRKDLKQLAHLQTTYATFGNQNAINPNAWQRKKVAIKDNIQDKLADAVTAIVNKLNPP